MKTVYLINDIVIFSPEECSLTPKLSWPAGRVTLHAPASECLHLLLAHPGEPVTQKVLFAQVWQKRGVVVSTNTLYQSIASIRKGLKAAGLEEDIIRTLPKQGFQCNATVQFGALQEFIHTPGVPSIEPDLAVEEIAVSEKKHKLANNCTNYPLMLSCLIAISMVLGVFYWQQSDNSDTSVRFYHAGHVDKCSLYSSWPGSEYSQSVFNELRKHYPLDCRNNHYAYLTINHMQTGSTLIFCNAVLREKGAQCRSIVFSDDVHENE